MKKELQRNMKILELYQHTTLTLEEIGKIWGLTKQRVKKIIDDEVKDLTKSK